jgi:hypothetical protein
VTDGGWVAADIGAVVGEPAGESLVFVKVHADNVPLLRVPRDDAKRAVLTTAADQQRQRRLSALRIANCFVELIVDSLKGRGFVAPECLHNPDALLQSVHALAQHRKGRPKDWCSVTFHPARIPRMKRPPLSWSIWAAMRASSAGWRKVMEETSGPKRMLSLFWATTVNEIKVSSTSRSRGPEREKKWSERQRDSKPESSVARMMRRQRFQSRPAYPSIMTPRSMRSAPPYCRSQLWRTC